MKRKSKKNKLFLLVLFNGAVVMEYENQLINVRNILHNPDAAYRSLGKWTNNKFEQTPTNPKCKNTPSYAVFSRLYVPWTVLGQQ